jgi:LPXTG-motif cell wall-anchored protein
VPTVEHEVEARPPAQVTPTTAAPLTALPTTGSASNLLVIVGVGSLLAGGALLLAGRRPKEA